MKKGEQLYEGKAKKVFATDDPDIVIVDYKDDATAFNGLKKGTIAGKGVINNKMSNMMFRIMEQHGIPTHYVEELSDRETAVKKSADRAPRGHHPQHGGGQFFHALRRARRQKAPRDRFRIQL